LLMWEKRWVPTSRPRKGSREMAEKNKTVHHGKKQKKRRKANNQKLGAQRLRGGNQDC